MSDPGTDAADTGLTVDVVVVGAGISGLSAAKAISEAGLDVVVLEARDRVGGRTWTTYVDGHELEMGGQWISSNQEALLELGAELGVELYPRYRDGDSVYIDRTASRRRFRGEFPVSEATQGEIARTLESFTELCREIATPSPWLHKRARELDGISWGAWLEATTEDEEARSIVSIFIADGMFAKPANAISMLQAVHMANSAGGFENLVDEDVLLDHRVVGGLAELSRRIAERLGSRVRLDTPVRQIAWSPTGVVVTSDDVTVRARKAVVTVPVNLCGAIRFEPPLPALRQQMHQHMSFGHIVKVQAFYEEPFWREEGLSGTAFAPHLTVHEVYDNSYADSDAGCLVGFISDEKADAYIALGPADRRDLALSCLEQYFGARAAAPTGFAESSWASEEWTRGAYGLSFDIGGLSRYGAHMRDPVGPIHWASSDIADEGYMHVDGGHRVGLETGRSVAEALSSRSSG